MQHTYATSTESWKHHRLHAEYLRRRTMSGSFDSLTILANIAVVQNPEQSCAPTNWWSVAALGGLMTGGGGGAPRIFHQRRRRGFMVSGGGVGGVRLDERALKQRTRWTGVFPGFTGGSHFTCDLC